MGRQPIQDTVEQLVRPFLEKENFELVGVEYVKEGSNRFLRVFIDKEGGIEIDDCGKVSEYLSAKLDETDPIAESYILEVSSPGAERPLKNDRDFANAVGKNVFVTTYEPIAESKEFTGKLLSFADGVLTVRAGEREYAIPVGKVASARLTIVI
ncbi:MAG TPA: ribosome maturation factor RimP [Bacilli bacterium]